MILWTPATNCWSCQKSILMDTSHRKWKATPPGDSLTPCYQLLAILKIWTMPTSTTSRALITVMMTWWSSHHSFLRGSTLVSIQAMTKTRLHCPRCSLRTWATIWLKDCSERYTMSSSLTTRINDTSKTTQSWHKWIIQPFARNKSQMWNRVPTSCLSTNQSK